MKNSYVLEKAPNDYPGKKYRGGFAYKHHLVWWRNTGELIPGGYEIHHKDTVRSNNEFKNLQLLTKSAHASLHSCKGRSVVNLECGYCSKKFTREVRNVTNKKSSGQKIFFCSRSCGTKHQHIAKTKEIEHGYSMYRKGCRCGKCREGNSGRMNIYRKTGS